MSQFTYRLGICAFSILLLAGCTSIPSATSTSLAGNQTTKELPGQIRIFVSADQRLLLNGKQVSSKHLLKKLQKLGVKTDAVIQIAADPESPFTAVVGVLRSLKDNGYSNVSMKVRE